ncbi:MAG: hypothetical protein ACHQ4H_04105 [Ktedonobacterales bacterium]
MARSVGELDARQIDRLRDELLWQLVTFCAYPPFFDYRTGKRRARPVDRETLDGTRQFLSSANFSALQNTDVSSPEVRRFLERLFLRYLEVNPHMQRPRARRRVPELRMRVPRQAAEVQRGLVALVSGNGGDFGARDPRTSWIRATKTRQLTAGDLEHRARLLETTLARTADAARMPVAVPAQGRRRAPDFARSSTLADATMPVQAHQGWPPAATDGGRQFSGYAEGGVPRGGDGIPGANAASARGGAAAAAQAPLTDDLYHLYGDYLRDMQPEVASPPTNGHRSQPAGPGAVSTPSRPAGRDPGPAPSSADLHIFWQLRYQLEAYVRRAVRSYGVQSRNDDPFALLDALRRSGFVDEADLRIAEGILALTDTVTAAQFATVEDYRQAMTLYLLYHRSHLGE